MTSLGEMALVLLVSVALIKVDAAPTSSPFKTFDFLSKFGYVQDAGMSRSFVADSHATVMLDLRGPISQYQQYNGLPVTGVIDAATLKLMNEPRCGNKDIEPSKQWKRNKRYVISGVSWPSRKLKYAFRNYPPHLPRSTVRQLVREAFQLWSNVSSLVFREASIGETAHIHMRYGSVLHGDSSPFDGQGGVFAHAFYPDRRDQLAGDTHYDTSESWWHGDQQQQGPNLFQVTVHEIGHALGLDHSNASQSIMRPIYNYAPNFHLSPDDVSAIQEIYGTASEPKVSAEPTVSPPTTVTYRPPFNSPLCLHAAVDAVVEIATETYIFIRNEYAILDKTVHGMSVRSGYPRPLSADWPRLGDVTARIDAAFYVPSTANDLQQLFIFQGIQVWRYSNWPSRQPDSGYPRFISQSFPGIPAYLDSAFTWNNQIYFTKGYEYYRYTSQQGIDRGYPKPLSLWSGLPANQRIDAAFQATDGWTYFFSGQNYFRFNDIQFKVEELWPLSTAVDWLGCAQQ